MMQVDRSTPESMSACVALTRGDGSSCVLGADQPPLLMGVLNLTPDSFSDGGLYQDPARARARAEALWRDGAAILDLGAESTRPGAEPVDAAEEWRRLAPVLGPLARAGLPLVLSVDTRHLETARRAADLGARLLNLPFPGHLLGAGRPAELAALLGAYDGVVLMHARGTPADMRARADYPAGRLLETVAAELLGARAELCCPPARVLYDPGLGFAKEARHSLALLGLTGALQRRLGRPLVVGASRKSFLGSATGLPVGERMVPSVAAALLAAAGGAAVLRVHDVAETRAALQLWLAAAAAAAEEQAGDAA